MWNATAMADDARLTMAPETQTASVRIRAKNVSYQIACEEGERLLLAGLRQGVPLAYECATGTCGTCRARHHADSIVDLWPEAPGGAKLKSERGEFLLCQSSVRGGCDIEIPGHLPEPDQAAILPEYHRGRLAGTWPLAEDVVGFEIALDRPCRFLAGQFFLVKVPGVAGYRAYSMANYEGETRRLRFVLRRQENGRFSQWLSTQGAPNGHGDKPAVELFGPLGKAAFRPEEGKNLLCLAGGSGVAGMLSILRHAVEIGYFERHRGHLFFGVRTLQDLFCLDELSELAARAGGGLEITLALSREQAPDERHPGHPALRLATGLVHEVSAAVMAGRYDNTVAFAAGPPGMIEAALHHLLLEARLPAGDIRYDKFT